MIFSQQTKKSKQVKYINTNIYIYTHNTNKQKKKQTDQAYNATHSLDFSALKTGAVVTPMVSPYNLSLIYGYHLTQACFLKSECKLCECQVFSVAVHASCERERQGGVSASLSLKGYECVSFDQNTKRPFSAATSNAVVSIFLNYINISFFLVKI